MLAGRSVDQLHLLAPVALGQGGLLAGVQAAALEPCLEAELGDRLCLLRQRLLLQYRRVVCITTMTVTMIMMTKAVIMMTRRSSTGETTTATRMMMMTMTIIMTMIMVMVAGVLAVAPLPPLQLLTSLPSCSD